VHAPYATKFLPAFVVLGLGMTISVAPLTTAVMNSVAQGRAGTASGINNAVARVAGVLSVAVFGVVMVTAFSNSLQRSFSGLKLSGDVVQELESNVDKLGSLDAPASVDPQTADSIRSAIAEAFVSGFRLIMLLCAVLAIVSAVVAWRWIPSRNRAR